MISTLICYIVVQTTVPAVKNYEFLEKSKNSVVVKVNPLGYHAGVFITSQSKDSEIAFNTNFFWKKKPIGYLKDFELIPSIWAHNGYRPVFTIDGAGRPKIYSQLKQSEFLKYSIISQSGPLLIYNGKVVYPTSLKSGKFKSDVSRVTKHSAIGITKEGKIIVVYCGSGSLWQMISKLQKAGAVSAMNCDGGGSSSLKVSGTLWGNPHPRVGIEFFPNKF